MMAAISHVERMRFRRLALLTTGLLLPAAAAELELPPRPGDARSGRELAAQVRALDVTAREAAVVAEVRRGNVPEFWRRFVAVRIAGAALLVSPDYLAVGADDDYFLVPLTAGSAQVLADDLGCVLPTRKMVDAIHRAAPLKLTPAPISPSAAMTTVPVFEQHHAMVLAPRVAALAAFPPGTLVAGHKKDVVITPQLAARPDRVAIYGWHQPDGTPIQPLHLGHAASWVDYSHGVRLVRREMTVDDVATTVDAVLADPGRCALLSDEGAITIPRYGADRGSGAKDGRPAQKRAELRFEPAVRVVLDTPARLDPAKPVRLILYALPAGNTIEQTIGRRPRPGDDWHFDLQHIGAQLRWLRAKVTDANLVLAYLQPDEKSWVLWRRKHTDHPRRLSEIVADLRARFPGSKLVLTGHSAGGGLTFGLLDGLEEIPDDVERIAFLDSNYAYDPARAHDAKLAQWLTASGAHRLCVLAYEDHLALLDGKTFVSEQGGTWGRSRAMLRDLGTRWPFARTDADGLQRHTALAGRVEFLLKENPGRAVLHTRQVELNGFIHAMLAGTELAGQGYVYLGARAYDAWIETD